MKITSVEHHETVGITATFDITFDNNTSTTSDVEIDRNIPLNIKWSGMTMVINGEPIDLTDSEKYVDWTEAEIK